MLPFKFDGQRKKNRFTQKYMLTALRWKHTLIPPTEEWMVKLMKMTEMAKLIALIKENVSTFVFIWKTTSGSCNQNWEKNIWNSNFRFWLLEWIYCLRNVLKGLEMKSKRLRLQFFFQFLFQPENADSHYFFSFSFLSACL